MAPRPLTSRLLARIQGARQGAGREAARVVAGLPAYQVALWPDGWRLEPDGGVRVCDTHEMAEARRWLTLMARNNRGRSRSSADAEVARTMRLYGLEVPPAVIALSGRRFASERVASVALTLVASAWIDERRHRLAREPERTLALARLAWSGSRHTGTPDPDAALDLLHRALTQCIDEGLVPRARYRLAAWATDAYGVPCCRCRVEVDLDPYAQARVREAVAAALIPWNRGVIRDGSAVPVIALEVGPRGDARGAGGTAGRSRRLSRT